MRRFILVISVLLSMTVMSSAQSLSIERARKLVPEESSLAYVAGNMASPDFCVFNNKEKKGFAIVACDGIFGDGILLGYSDEGEFDYEKLPDNAKWLLSQYREQIDSIREHKAELAANVSNTAGKVVVSPLLAGVAWGQSEPYNRQCPLDGSYRSVTGCGATAMAQVMWYYRWPLTGSGKSSYRWKNKTLSVDYSKSEYDWSLMPGKYAVGRYSSAEADAVSKLMYDCGVSIEMEYSAGGSGAYMYMVSGALTKYFKYESAHYKYRYGNSTDWNAMLRKELDSRRPVITGGQSRTEGGHAFVCDGYDSNDYFHYNFGWGGIGNGYFLSSVAGGFPDDQEYIYEIIPDREKMTAAGVAYNQLCKDKVEVTYPDDVHDGYSGKIVIPSEIACDSSVYAVTSIGPSAFALSDVSVVDIPSSVRTIVAGSMFGCSMIDSIYVHWNTPVDCDATVFDNGVYSTAALIVPKGKVGTYSQHLPWSLFSNIVEEGETSEGEWSEWQPVSENYSAYIYGWKMLDMGQTNVTVYSRSYVLDENTVQYKVDGGIPSSLLINVDLATGQCKVPKQSTGMLVNDNDELFVCDCPTYDRHYTYKSYPCSFDSEVGIMSLNLVYYSMNGGYYAITKDSLLLDGYPVYDISLGDVAVSEYGEVSCQVECSKDVAMLGYVILPKKMSRQEQAEVMDDIKAGRLELEYTTERTLTAQLTESDSYTLMAVSVSGKGKIQKYAAKHLSYMASVPEWVEEYVGSYHYQAWKKITQDDVRLLHDISNPRYWKLASMYNGSEFVFRWYDDQTLEFDEQPSGFEKDSYPVNVLDNKYSDKSQKRGSYYDSSKRILYFDTYYSSSVTKYGVEAFVIESETPVSDIRYESGQKHLIYNVYGHRLDFPQKGLNIIDGRKVFIE